MRVGVYKTKANSQVRWCVSRREAGKRKRSFFASKDSANAEATRIKKQIATAGAVWCELPAADRDALISAYQLAKEKGLDLRKLIENADAKPEAKPMSLGDAIAELITSKRGAGRSPAYVDALESSLSSFSKGIESIPIAKVDLSQVESWLLAKPLVSRSTLRARLATLFKYCIRKGYRTDNPCERLELVTAPKEPPKVFTPEQAQKCLKSLKAEHCAWLPWFVLSTFCGLRPEEAQHTTAKDINFKEGWVKVEAQTTKVRERRVVYPMAQAVKLLKSSCRIGMLPVSTSTRKRIVKYLRGVLGFSRWPKDITRHSAASYWLAISDDASAVAHNLGHSEATLKRNYKALVTKAESEKFWNITL